ncbi:MAG TPA: VWA domain-containing protein [Lutibacter sp.]|nr:VWA domain-containing protein [Lutibacter sp.]
MNISILYYLLSVGFALLIAAALYYIPKKKKSCYLFGLRFLSVLSLLTLLINPKWEREELTIEKPQLVIAVDNSASIAFVKGKETVENILSELNKNTNLQDKFTIKHYSFGKQTKVFDSLTFAENQSNPTDLIRQMDALSSREKTPIFLITDGNQTLGTSYEYVKTKNKVFPIIVGDTTQYTDLAITKINVNQYSFLDNQFPVEIFTLYTGIQNTGAQLSIFNNKKRIFTKKLSFSEQKNTQHVSVMLPANTIGNHYYQAVISKLENEKNTKNNRKDFSVEVVDQQTEILILSSFSHPDLGAIKNSIESNKQRKATIVIGSGSSLDFSKYKLVVLYQPTTIHASALKSIQNNKNGKFIITGTKTDWQFLNTNQKSFSKKTTSLTEQYLAVYNSNFPEFVTKEIGFEELPPLDDRFGAISFQTPYQSVLFQKIGHTITETPLLATYEEDDQKNVVLFGEGFWKWRMLSKITHKSNKPFDDFWGNIFQYTTQNKKTNQLQLAYKKLFYSNEQVQIKATYVDQNYQIDTQASLWLYLANKETKETQKSPFHLNNNQYFVELSNIESGKYTFQVKVLDKDVVSYGSFKVLDYNVEQQFSTSNLKGLKNLALQTGGKLIYPNTLESVIENFINDTQYKPIQKSKIISKPLIDWQWLLGFIILPLSIEWFIRKYKGLI